MSHKAAQPRLIALSAPSGAGKSTLCSMLIKEFPTIGLSISATTRPKRPYEKEGEHYHFLTREEFEKNIAKGLFAEWATVHNNLYGTPKSEIDRRISQNQHVLFDIDVQGAMSLKTLYPERTLLIFIDPPSMEILEKRLRERKGDSPGSIETRLQNAYNELRWRNQFNYQIVNDDLNQSYQQLKTIVKKECLL